MSQDQSGPENCGPGADHTEDLLSMVSPTAKTNSSVKLLRADFDAFLYFLRTKTFAKAALKITRPTGLNLSRDFEPFSLPQTHGSNRTGRSHTKRPKQAYTFLIDNFVLRGSCSNCSIGSKTCLLEFSKDADVLHIPDPEYRDSFHNFETYLTKMFSINPSLRPLDQGSYINEDSDTFVTMLNYIRLYEKAMHVLSKKQHTYFYLSLFVLIILLRNLRRFLCHYKANAAFVHFFVLLSQGIWMCQDDLHRSFLAKHPVHNTWAFNMYSDFTNEYTLDAEAPPEAMGEHLEKLNAECNRCRACIHELCKENSEEIRRTEEASREWNDDATVCDAEEEPDLDDGPAFYDATHRMTSRQDTVETTLESARPDIASMPNLNIAIDGHVCKWITELCRLAALYCKIGRGPVLLHNRYIKADAGPRAALVPRLAKRPRANLSAFRDFRLRTLSLKPAVKPPKPAPQPQPIAPAPTRPSLRPNLRHNLRPKPQQRETVRYIMNRRQSGYTRWTEEDVRSLVIAVNRHRPGNWKYIAQVYFLGKKSPMQLKDKWANLLRYNHVRVVEQPTGMQEFDRYVLVERQLA